MEINVTIIQLPDKEDNIVRFFIRAVTIRIKGFMLATDVAQRC